MVKVTELRIGNWVEEEVLGWVQVDVISNVTIAVLASNLKIDRTVELVTYTMSPDNLSPIPLSPEIFEKCGFDYRDFQIDTWYNNDIGYIERYEDGYTLTDSDGEPSLGYVLKFLHQLQNLFYSLTGKELEINL